MTIGEYVRQEKDARGWTLEDLFRETGIRTGHLSRLINRPPQNPDVDTVEKFAKAFRVKPADIWNAISDNTPVPRSHLEQVLYARVGRQLSKMSPEKQEKALQLLEQTAEGLAVFDDA